MTEKMYNVGKIVNTHGVRGELKVLRITDFEERFTVGETLYVVRENNEPLPLVIDGHRFNKGFDLIHFTGYNDINDVEALKGTYLQIAEEQLTELDENEFYYHEIIGCDVFTIGQEKIGTITEILDPGANDVWVVKREYEKDVLIPYIEDVVKAVDIEQAKVTIEPMEGLLD